MALADVRWMRPPLAGLEALTEAIDRHGGDWAQTTAIPRLQLIRSTGPVGPLHLVYEPLVCFVAAGGKETMAGDRRIAYGAGSFLVSSFEVPVSFSIVGAPYAAATLQLDAGLVADLLLELGERHAPVAPREAGLAAHPMSEELLDAVTRLVALLDAPQDAGVLAPRIEAEVLLRLLRGPAGATVRQLALADGNLRHVRAAAAWIRAHLAEPLRVEEIAAVAAMSPASLHRHFRTATGMSPLQFHKRLRLQAARRALLGGEVTAAAAGAAVGYASASQFARDYTRAFGAAPAADARRLRAAAGVAALAG